jgi:hypothetical protein
MDGDWVVVVRDDFINLHISPAVFIDPRAADSQIIQEHGLMELSIKTLEELASELGIVFTDKDTKTAGSIAWQYKRQYCGRCGSKLERTRFSVEANKQTGKILKYRYELQCPKYSGRLGHDYFWWDMETKQEC